MTDKSPTSHRSDLSSSAVSTHTIFGQIRYLEQVSEKLYDNHIAYGKDVELLTEREFLDIVGPRVTPENRRRIKQRMKEINLVFRPG